MLLVGFFAHMCVSTTAREGLMRGLAVEVDPQATGGYPLDHPILGAQSAEEVTRTALLQLSHMGVSIASHASDGSPPTPRSSRSASRAADLEDVSRPAAHRK